MSKFYDASLSYEIPEVLIDKSIWQEVQFLGVRPDFLYAHGLINDITLILYLCYCFYFCVYQITPTANRRHYHVN